MKINIIIVMLITAYLICLPSAYKLKARLNQKRRNSIEAIGDSTLPIEMEIMGFWFFFLGMTYCVVFITYGLKTNLLYIPF